VSSSSIFSFYCEGICGVRSLFFQPVNIMESRRLLWLAGVVALICLALLGASFIEEDEIIE
jgi:hypothetical protein